MKDSELEKLLVSFKEGAVSLDHITDFLKDFPLHQLGETVIDRHRLLRTGMPEVIYCEGKSNEQIEEIIQSEIQREHPFLATRLSNERAKTFCTKFPALTFHKNCGCLSYRKKRVGENTTDSNEKNEKLPPIPVMTAGTSDVPVAEEAAITLDLMGIPNQRIYDVGVAGIHRLTEHLPALRNAPVAIVIAGMEGALPSVVAGLCDTPVLAVPTSVGYGTHFKGVTALLAMLNSCAGGISVFNIDNGFGAAVMAIKIWNKWLMQHSGKATFTPIRDNV